MADFNNYKHLTQAVNLIPPQDNFFSKNFFKKREVSYADKVVIGKEALAPSGVARFKNKEHSAAILTKLGGETLNFVLAETHEKYIFSADEFANMKTLGSGFINGASSDRLAEWNKFVLKHAGLLKERVERRFEMLCAQAISTGEISVTENGITYSADFGFEENKHYYDVAGVYFSVTTKDPLASIRNWIKSVKRKSGLNDIVVIMGESAADAYMAHEKVTNSLNLLNYPVGQLKPFQSISGFGGDMIHMLPGGWPIYEYKNVYVDAEAVVTDMVDPKVVIVAALSGDYRKYAGVINKFKPNSTDIDQSAVEMLSELRQNEDRTEAYISLRAKLLPVILNPDSIEVHKVLAG